MGAISCLERCTNRRGVLGAVSVDRRGRRPSYGETGANILVCGSTSDDAGRAAITTLAPQGGTRTNFGGTSAAAPMVSGAAALVLAANLALSWRDVRLLLARTARRNDASSPDWVTSGPGLPHHPEYGFGTVDAQAAANAARGWSSVGGSSSLIACGPYARSPGLAVPDGPAGATIEDRVVNDAARCGLPGKAQGGFAVACALVAPGALGLRGGELRGRGGHPVSRRPRPLTQAVALQDTPPQPPSPRLARVHPPV